MSNPELHKRIVTMDSPSGAELKWRGPRIMSGASERRYFRQRPITAGNTQGGNVDGANAQRSSSPSVVADGTTTIPHDLPDAVPATNDNGIQDSPATTDNGTRKPPAAAASWSGRRSRVRPADLSSKKGKNNKARNRSNVYRVVKEIKDHREVEGGREYLISFEPTVRRRNPDNIWILERFVARNLLQDYWT